MKLRTTILGDRSGFTLIELMVGLLISTLIVGAAASVFVTATQSWEKGSSAHRLLHEARTIGDLVEKHLRSAIDPNIDATAIFWGEDLSEGDIRGHRLNFRSTAQGRFPRSLPLADASEVEFSFDPAENYGFEMRVDSTPDEFGDDGGYFAALSADVIAFQVTYYDGEEWLDEWFRTVLPEAVEFRITIADMREEVTNEEARRTIQISRLISMPGVMPGRIVPEEEGAAIAAPQQ